MTKSLKEARARDADADSGGINHERDLDKKEKSIKTSPTL